MYSTVGGYGGILPWENLNFQSHRNAFFWPSDTVVCIITDAVTTKLKVFLEAKVTLFKSVHF